MSVRFARLAMAVAIALSVASALAGGARAAPHRVMTFNLKDEGAGPAKGKQIRQAARLIARTKPDVVGLQEVCVEDADHLKRRLRRAHRLRYHEQPGSVDDFGCARGQATLSRNPIAAWGNIVLGDLGDGEKRGYLWVETKLGERRVRVYNTHLGLWSACVRRDVTRKLARRADRHRPLIFMGDFNASPGQSCGRKPVLGPFYNRFQEVDQLAAHETLPGAGKIDYIFTGGFRVKRARVFQTPATDHLPLLGVLAD